MSFIIQNELFPTPDTAPLGKTVREIKDKRSGTFVDNLKLPVHRWFRYSAGFSAGWACELMKDKRCSVLDPFAGSGTTLLVAESLGIEALGFEAHPFIYRVARAKLLWHLPTSEFIRACAAVIENTEAQNQSSEAKMNGLLSKCYSASALSKLLALRAAYLDLKNDDPVWELVWLALTGILRSCSNAGTAQWQYILPNKKKSKVIDPTIAFRAMTQNMSEDMEFAQRAGWKKSATIELTDARNPAISVSGKYSLVITSPPYPNNYDYADATRLEMTFWGEVTGWGELQEVVRKYLIRSCSQHSAAEKLVLHDLIENPLLKPIQAELQPICESLAEIRLTKGGKKTYHTMIVAYFLDLAEVWGALRFLCAPGAEVCFVIGDSAPYGVYVPVDKWLGDLALSHGFKNFKFEKIRDRNVKWKNRKHRVPLHEGRLWVYG